MAEEKEPTKFEETASDHSPVSESGDVIDEKKLLRKIDLHLIPGLFALLLLSFLDRGNVGNALIEGLTVDLHMTMDQFITAVTLYVICLVLFEIPCNIMLKLTTPRFWLPTITIIWGTITTLTGLTQNFSGFAAARFFLGVVDSGFIPGVVFYMSMWYRRNEQIYRIALFLSVYGLAGAFGGIFAFCIAKMRGVAGLAGWRWIFIIEGLLTVVTAVGAYFFIYNYPATARFLTPRERERVLAWLKEDSDAARDEKFTWEGVAQALRDPKIWLYNLCSHTIMLPVTGLLAFLPTIIRQLGFTSAQAQLLTVPPYVAAFVSIMVTALFAGRTGLRAPFIIPCSAVAIIGFVILITGNRPMVSYGGTILAVSGVFSASAVIVSWPVNNVSGQTKRAVASALQLSVGNLGAVAGIQIYRSKWAPKYLTPTYVVLGYLSANIVITCILWYILKSENARRDRGERDDRLKDVDAGIFLGDDDPRWRFHT